MALTMVIELVLGIYHKVIVTNFCLGVILILIDTFANIINKGIY